MARPEQVRLPRRPRLADHLLARRHVADGEEKIVLHDLRTGRLMAIGPREWGLLSAADGTRDLDGILLAAARDGARATAATLAAFLEQLHAVGALAEDGAGPARAAPPATAPGPASPFAGAATALLPAEPLVPAGRPLDPLPAFGPDLAPRPGSVFSLRCDGGGSCCRLYATVLFAPVEAARARSLLPCVLDGGARHERVFLPERGSAPSAGSAVSMVDGRCAYLSDAGRCSIHETAGEAAKPLGCRHFPATFTDDGEAVRVSVAVECACVLASAGSFEGAPVLSVGLRVRGDLDEAIHIAQVPAEIELTPGVRAGRAGLVAWSRAVVEAPAPADGVAAFWSLAGALARDGLDPASARHALTASLAPGSGDLAPWIGALHARASRRASEDAGWRGQRDLARRATRWIAAAASRLLDGEACRALLAAPPPSPLAEGFYLRAVLHGHLLVDDLPLVVALRDRAVRLLVARALPAAIEHLPEGPPDPAAAQPLALVEAMLRGHGLGAYAHDLPPGA